MGKSSSEYILQRALQNAEWADFCQFYSKEHFWVKIKEDSINIAFELTSTSFSVYIPQILVLYHLLSTFWPLNF